MKRAFEVTKTIRPGLTPKWSISEYTTIHDHYDGDIRKDSSGLSTSIDVAIDTLAYFSEGEWDVFGMALAFGMRCLKEKPFWRDELGKVQLEQ